MQSEDILGFCGVTEAMWREAAKRVHLAPIPSDRDGQPSSACKYLVGLANHTGPDGTGALPVGGLLVCYTSPSERTRAHLPGAARSRGATYVRATRALSRPG